MKDFLNKYMDAERNPAKTVLDQLGADFEGTVKAVHDALGSKPFHIRSGLNAAVFDSVMAAFYGNPGPIPTDIRTRFNEGLLKNSKYLAAVSSSTTDNEVVESRITLASTLLFG